MLNVFGIEIRRKGRFLHSAYLLDSDFACKCNNTTTKALSQVKAFELKEEKKMIAHTDHQSAKNTHLC